ncbi:MAG: thrombospondin type 3 repeat-containing protein [Flavobacteriia bacterium]
MKSLVDRIKTLVELRDKGSISKEEFDQMLALLDQEQHRENKDASVQHTASDSRNIEKSGKRVSVLLGSVGGGALLFVLSFFTMFPAFLWDKDGDGFHTYRNDNCPAVSGTCQGCFDGDNDGFADSEDECPKESSKTCKGCPDKDNDGVADKADTCVNQPGSLNCSGCPDRDGDGVRDSLDQCPEEKGLKIFHGCSKERMLELERIKLKQGLAIKVPPSCKSTAGEHWIRFVNGYYEFSEFETKGFRDVKSNQTVQELNAYFDLKGTLKPKPQKPKIPKPDPFISRKGLTQMEESELNELRLKELNGELLTPKERMKKHILEMKRYKHVN